MRKTIQGKTKSPPRTARREAPDTASHTARLAALRALFSRVPDWVIVLLLFTLFLLQAVPSLWQDAPTFDETMRQLSGYLHLTAGEFRIHPGHPPLAKMVAALPLLFMNVKIAPPPGTWDDVSRWKFAHDFLYLANNAERLILLGRLAILPLTLLPGYFVFRWSKELFGRGAATFALFLYCFEPNILAHGRLMNTDMPVAGFFFLTMYSFAQTARGITLCRLGFTGLSLGLALATKSTALFAGPILILLGIAFVLSSRPMTVQLWTLSPVIARGWVRKLVLVLGALIVIGLTAYGVLWGVYGFRYVGGTMDGYAYARPWEEVLPEASGARAVVRWARDAKLLPEAYLYGLCAVSERSTRSAFLMGAVSIDGWWYYFLVTFLLKTPLPLLVLLGLAFVSVRTIWKGKRLEMLFLFLPVFVYFAIASASRFNIGHRHLLPIYPFLFVLVSGLIPWTLRQRPKVKGTVAVLAAWYLVSSVSIFPHYLAYFNELIGGPNQGYKYLVDSNLDWGQDLKGLKRYMDDHGIPRVWLSYFGTADPDDYGIAYNYLAGYPILRPSRELVSTPFVAISATNLQGVYFEDRDLFKRFRERQPVAKIGYSIFIYRLN